MKKCKDCGKEKELKEFYHKTFYMSSYKYCGGVWEDELTLIHLTELEKFLLD